MEDTALQFTQEVNKQKSFIQQIVNDIKGDLVVFGMKVIFACVVFLIGSLIIHLIRKAVKKGLTKVSEKNGFRNIHFVDQIIKYVLYAILIFIIAGYFGASATSIVAVLGSAGLTLGLGFQGALSNLAGGFLILLHKPFKIGDYLVVDNPRCEGKVTQIGMIYSTLEQVNLKSIQVPNGILANSVINNLSYNGYRLMEVIVSVSYSADIVKAKEIMLRIAKDNSYINRDMNINVFVNDLAQSGVELGLRAYVDVDVCRSAKWSLLEAIKVEFDKNGIEIPFTQLDVHISNNSSENK